MILTGDSVRVNRGDHAPRGVRQHAPRPPAAHPAASDFSISPA